MTIVADLTTLSDSALTDAWRNIGSQKLKIRKSIGWEGDGARALLNVWNENLDRVLSEMSRREQEARVMRRGRAR